MHFNKTILLVSQGLSDLGTLPVLFLLIKIMQTLVQNKSPIISIYPQLKLVLYGEKMS